MSIIWMKKEKNITYLLICSLNSLLCSVHRTLSPDKPLMRAEAATIRLRHLSASSISNCKWKNTCQILGLSFFSSLPLCTTAEKAKSLSLPFQPASVWKSQFLSLFPLYLTSINHFNTGLTFSSGTDLQQLKSRHQGNEHIVKHCSF